MARSFGLSNREILVRVILKESVPAIVNSVTLATINCVGSTAMAGAVGAGGLGSVALNYGFYSFNDLVLYTSVIITLIIVQLIQLQEAFCITDVSENNHVFIHPLWIYK